MKSDIKLLGEVCDFYNGKAHEKVIDETGDFKVVNSKFVSTNGSVYKKTKSQMFPLVKGDICMVMSDVPNGKALAKCYMIEEDNTYSLNQRICAIRTDNFDLQFLFYQLNRHPHFLAFNNGENQTNLRKADILQCPLWCPSLEIQKQMVAKLDAAFADIEKAKQKAEQNLKNARELFDSQKLQIFDIVTNESLLTPISDVCEEIFAGGDAPKHSLSKERTDTFNIPIYANAVKNNGLYGFTEKPRVISPSVTVAARGSGTGHTEIRKEPFLPIVRLIVLTPDLGVVNVEYLLFAVKNLDILRSGSAIPQLTVPMIKGYSIPLPNLSKQHEVIDKLTELQSLTDDLSVIYSKKIKMLDELKQSILQKAFSSEL
ncbi:restriction endonuclease subunit S [Vibrio anguillarum]|uniref:restriction endonuclease subunit S n=1 Tax=Vibrio anguillarum TaxID=55601 RepID=UPI0011DEAD73|nr:restriction endonuclease subunit S [Vibrio anguillarum]TYC91477.1 hypothetical protein FXB64_10700 [Vibrio anguillarum]TYC95728.1 hypothetical protein FXB62_09745 [Vibrio anguillarum]